MTRPRRRPRCGGTATGPSIGDLLAGRWQGPASGRALRLPVRRIAIEPSLDGAEADLVAPLALGARLALVSDRNTWEALGRRVARALAPLAQIDGLVVEEPQADLRTAQVDEAALLRRFSPDLGRQCLAELQAKALDPAAAERLNAKLAADWAALAGRLRQAMLPTARLQEAMTAAGAPTTAADLGLAPELYRAALRHAREIRHRFTILDLAAEADLLDAWAEAES